MSTRIYKHDGEWAAHRQTGSHGYGVTGCANPVEAWWHTSRLCDWWSGAQWQRGMTAICGKHQVLLLLGLMGGRWSTARALNAMKPCGSCEARCAPSASDSEWCRRCGGPNVVWSAQSPLWNMVMRGNDINGDPIYGDLVCMPCFVALAEEAGLSPGRWRLTMEPEPEGLIYTTPSGRVWDDDKFLWMDPSTDAGDDDAA